MSAVVFLFLFFLSSGLAALPNGWKQCKSTAPDVNTCLAREIKAAIKSLANGDKKLGVLPLDPLKIDKIVIPKGSGSVALDLIWMDMNVYGLKDLTIKEIKNDWTTAEVIAHVPQMPSIGRYKAEGKVLLLPIKGEGICNITLDDLDFDVKFKFRQEIVNGTEYTLMEQCIVDFQPKRVYLYFEGLFNNNKVLDTTINQFLNDNWKEIYQELRPAFQQSFSVLITSIANNILSKIPYKEIHVL